ncbi:MAG: RagB/SusD family nutrient uptake outer membrane protein [Gemmatimonadetes bacterium]|nr:RagB/SusD family nutrient uptake outer membrane protein [Gemmatimonadota bacterium]
MKVVTRSNAANTRQNKIYRQNGPDLAVSVDPKFWNVTWIGVADPRVKVTNVGIKGQDGLTPMWRQTKYTADNTPIRLASYVEARLVIAEVEGGQTAVDIINDLHRAAGIPLFASSNAEEIRQQVREERRREFFLEGKRMGDLRRYGGGAFAAAAGGRHPYTLDTYGGMECFPLPNVELLNNPNLRG